MEIDSDYLVRSPKLIVSHLEAIVKNRCIISASVDDNASAFLTVITDINQENNTLVVDGAPSELLNRTILSARNVIFNTQIDGIKVSFSGKDLRKVFTGGTVAFEMTIPNSLLWLQRRKYFRVKIPMSHKGSFFEMDNGKTIMELPILSDGISAFPLADLSISGFAALNPNPQLANLFQTEKVIAGPTLHLHDGSITQIGFIVKEITEIHIGNSKEQRIGCQFTNLSPAFESKIQHYMMHIERQIKKLGL